MDIFCTLHNLVMYGTIQNPMEVYKKAYLRLDADIPLPPEWEKSADQAKICVCAQILHSHLYQDKTFASFFKEVARHAKTEALGCFAEKAQSNSSWAIRMRNIINLPQIGPNERSKSVTYALVRLTAEGFNDVKKLWDEKGFNLPEHTEMLERLGRAYIDLNGRQNHSPHFPQTFPYIRDSSITRALPRARL
jgi:hypothetical protein